MIDKSAELVRFQLKKWQTNISIETRVLRNKFICSLLHERTTCEFLISFHYGYLINYYRYRHWKIAIKQWKCRSINLMYSIHGVIFSLLIDSKKKNEKIQLHTTRAHLVRFMLCIHSYLAVLMSIVRDNLICCVIFAHIKISIKCFNVIEWANCVYAVSESIE